jgi:hypothetical protein
MVSEWNIAVFDQGGSDRVSSRTGLARVGNVRIITNVCINFNFTLYLNINLMSVCPCIVDNMKRENQLDATQWFYLAYISPNMFRALLYPSSGA